MPEPPDDFERALERLVEEQEDRTERRILIVVALVALAGAALLVLNMLKLR